LVCVFNLLYKKCKNPHNIKITVKTINTRETTINDNFITEISPKAQDNKRYLKICH